MRFLIIAALLECGCNYYLPGQTHITEEVWRVSGENPATASPAALRVWFGEHREFAAHIVEECRAQKQHKLAYADTTEAAVCAAASDMQLQRAGRDHVGF